MGFVSVSLTWKHENIPEGNGGNPSHERVGSHTLQMEQGAVKKQQQDNVLTDDEAPSTLSNDWDVLENTETEQNNHQHRHPQSWLPRDIYCELINYQLQRGVEGGEFDIS